MLIAGCGGHAVEILDILESQDHNTLTMFDDTVTDSDNNPLFSKYTVLNSIEKAKELFAVNKEFCLGVGTPAARKILFEKLIGIGGHVVSVISNNSFIGKNSVILNDGLNIMHFAAISGRTSIGTGTLIHSFVSVHHDVRIGDFCELSPGCRILGNAKIGSLVSIGTNAVVMRNISIGDNAVIGAGAVVTKNVSAGQIVAGVPAKEIQKKK